MASDFTELGEISIKQNSPRQAENYLVKALTVLPDHVSAVVALADTKLLLAKDSYVTASQDQLYKEAETLYLKAAAADPENADYYMKLGSFYRVNMKNNDKAKENYNLYVDKGGRDSAVNTWLAEVGGTPRSEIAAASTMASNISTTGAVVTTATATLTTGPQGAITTLSTESAPVNPGVIVLPVDQMVAETSASEAMTSAPAALPLPGQSPQIL